MNKIVIISLISFIIFSGCGSKTSNYTIVKDGEKEGVLLDNSKVSIKPIFTHIKRFEGNEEKYYHPNYINFHWICDEKGNEFAIVQDTNKKFGIIDKNANLLLKPIYDEISSFYNGYAKIRLKDKFGLIDSKFKVVVKPIYDGIEEYPYDTIVTKLNSKYGCISRDLKVVIKPIFDRIYLQSEGLKRVELNGKWGYIDKNCKIIVKPIYDYAYDFINGVAKVIKSKKIGYINKDGKFISKPIYNDGDNF